MTIVNAQKTATPRSHEKPRGRVHRLMSTGHTAGVMCIAALAAVLCIACTSLDFSVRTPLGGFPAYPPARFAVFSDPHLFLPSLGAGDPAFKKYEGSNGRLLASSAALLSAVTEKIISARPHFVVVPGDLTKDGEEANHIAFARAMDEFRAVGISVFVVPGNHDVHNPNAVKYEGGRSVRIANVDPERFAEIYHECGYGAAFSRDPFSLAYAAEPVPGLWLLALDACRYDRSLKEGRAQTGGSLTKERLDWIKAVLERARGEGKAVIAAMHHGVLEHFPGQKRWFAEYVVENHDGFSRLLAEYGVRIVFTGHFHAQSIVGAWWDGNDARAPSPQRRFVFDIETGSLAAYPCPYRLVEIGADQILRVRSFRIDELPGRPAGFQEFALAQFKEGARGLVKGTLERYGIAPDEAERIAIPMAEAAAAHAAGDARFRGTETYAPERLSLLGRIVVSATKDFIAGLWNGVPPHADNDIDIDLRNGTYRTADGHSPSFDALKNAGDSLE